MTPPWSACHHLLAPPPQVIAAHHTCFGHRPDHLTTPTDLGSLLWLVQNQRLDKGWLPMCGLPEWDQYPQEYKNRPGYAVLPCTCTSLRVTQPRACNHTAQKACSLLGHHGWYLDALHVCKGLGQWHVLLIVPRPTCYLGCSHAFAHASECMAAHAGALRLKTWFTRRESKCCPSWPGRCHHPLLRCSSWPGLTSPVHCHVLLCTLV